jgi:hypothetical protein
MTDKTNKPNADKPTQAGPRDQRAIDAQEALRNDTLGASDHEIGLDSARDRNAALGESTGNARRTADAAGGDVDEHTADDAQRALRNSRGGPQNQ